jgi:hypothetical protein
MEQPCYKCGQAVEEGVRFCPNCGAPQIRVVLAEPMPGTAANAEAAHPAVLGKDADYPAAQTLPVLAVPMGWSQAIKPCALASIVATILMLLGLHPLVAMFSVGFLAVVFYRQGRAGMAIKTGTGIRLGAFGGITCFAITALLVAIAAALPDTRAKLRDEMIQNLQKSAAAHPGDAMVQSVIDQLKTPEGFTMILIIVGIVLLIAAIVLGTLGGALGAAIFGRRERS